MKRLNQDTEHNLGHWRRYWDIEHKRQELREREEACFESLKSKPHSSKHEIELKLWMFDVKIQNSLFNILTKSHW